ncbi:MAG: thioredoxin fold domain-containing protein [Rhizobiaceae bacterium]|nr:thioredoxin fold domain-containing protein [Rhizobiaceae bacterium]
MRKFNLSYAAGLIAAIAISQFVFMSGAGADDRGKLIGGMEHSYPEWFKESFLDFKEDAREAADANKHTILFMSLNGCSYCTRMLNESFAENRALIEKDFDTIGLNIKGDRMVMSDGENEITEKQLARKMRVRFTPTIVFLDENAETVFRINGFWDSAQFRNALAYISTRSYQEMGINQFMKARKSESIWDFRKLELMSDNTDFSSKDRPLLVLFEDAGCTTCGEVYDDLLGLDEVKEVLKTYDFVRLDARSQQAIIDNEGNATTAEKWAAKLGVSTSPTFVAFNEGIERQRVESRLYSFHFVSLLSYVSGKYYKTYDSWLKFNSQRLEEALASGVDVDLSDGRSSATK